MTNTKLDAAYFLTLVYIFFVDDQPPQITADCPESFEIQADGPDAPNVTWAEPEFEEPHGYNLTVESSHTPPTTLPWGDTNITYTATSMNNNKQVACYVNIFVKRKQYIYIYIYIYFLLVTLHI